MDTQQTPHTFTSPTAPNSTPTGPSKKLRKKKLLLIAGAAVGIIVIVVITMAAQPQPAVSPNLSEKVAECSPRNTPTCGPDGKPIGNDTGATNEIKILSLAVSKVQLSGAGPQGLDIDPATGYAYIGNNGNIIAGCEGDTTKPGANGQPAPVKAGAHTLSIIDPLSLKELKRVDTETAVIWTQVDSKRGVVYAAGSGNGKIGIHALGTGVKVGSISVGGKPHAFGLYNDTLITSNTNDDTQTYFTSINAVTKQVIKAQKAPELPHGIAYDSSKNVFYMVGVKTGDVAVIDASTGEVKDTFAGTGGSFGNSNMLAFSNKSRKLFISDTQQTSSVTAVNVDTRKIEGRIRFTQSSAPAWGMQVDDQNGLLYVALPNADAVGIAEVSSLKPVGIVKVDTCPYAVRLDTQRGLAVTANQVNATASVFKLSEVKSQLNQ